MLISLEELVDRYRMKIEGVLHVGAHLGEEAPVYHRLAVGDVTWVEGNPDLIRKLRARVRRFNHFVIEALVSDEEEEAVFNITNNGESSSLLELGTHKVTSPSVFVAEQKRLKTHRIDNLYIPHFFNFLNLDLQGYELHALRGMPNRLKYVDYVYSEVNKREVYVGCALVEQMDEFLSEFERVETHWCVDGGIDHGWGDCLYVRRSLL